jgi:hypothetical protein
MYMGVSENGVVYSKVPKLDILNGENGDKSLEFAGLGLDNRMSWILDEGSQSKHVLNIVHWIPNN